MESCTYGQDDVEYTADCGTLPLVTNIFVGVEDGIVSPNRLE